MGKPQELKHKKLILITGLPGSGKSTFAKNLAVAGAKVLIMGDVVRDEALKRGISRDIKSMANFMVWLRKEHGEQYIAKAICDKVSQLDDELIVVDGVRSFAEVNYFRSKFEKVLLVAIVSSAEKRFSRLKARGRRDDPDTLEELKRRDETELLVGVGSVIEGADITVVNDGTLDEMKMKAKQVLDLVSN
ncbi:MAG: AAA family ATPase [Thermoproteota archaeon]